MSNEACPDNYSSNVKNVNCVTKSTSNLVFYGNVSSNSHPPPPPHLLPVVVVVVVVPVQQV